MIISARQALALAFAGAMLAGCASNAVPGANPVSGANASSALRSISLIAPDSGGPKINSVTPIQAEQTQKIVIKGKRFGRMKPYNGDSCCIKIVVTNPACYDYGDYGTWQAGYEGSGNEVTLNVTKWTNEKIVLAGFTGLYGYYCWYLVAYEPIQINIWNAQSQAGPATWNGTIQ